MAIHLPYQYIAGLPREAQFQIWRDFQVLIAGMGGGSSVYDAIIDPGATAPADAANHIYINLTNLVAHETLTAGRTFTVGVIPRNDETVTETGTITLSGPLAILALGMTNSGVGNPFGVGSRVKWDLAGNTINTTYSVFFQGLAIYNSGSQISGVVTGAAGIPFFDNCAVYGSDIVTASGTTRKITAPSASTGVLTYATDTYFDSVQFRGGAILKDMHYSLTPALGTSFTLLPNDGDFVWDGGTFSNHQSSATTITIGGSSDEHYIRFARVGTIIDGSTSSGTHRLTINNSGKTVLLIEGLANPFSLTLGSGTGEVRASGTAWSNVLISGNSGNPARMFTGSVTAGLDVTGPAYVDAYVTGSTTVSLAGTGVHARLEMRAMSAAPWLTIAGLDDSEVLAVFAAPGASAQAYTVSSTSNRNVFVFAGTTHTNFSVASTFSSTDSTLITEAGISGPAATLTGDVTGTLTATVIDLLTRATSTTISLRTKVTGDAANRWQIDAAGRQDWGDGTNAVDTSLRRTAANQLGTDDDFAIVTAGKGLLIKEGSNAKMGTATLVAGTATVATTAVTANSRIFLTTQSLGTVATPMAVAVTTRNAGTDFTITSEDGTDTSVVAWMIVEPA